MDIPTVVLGKEIQPFHRELLNIRWQPGWEGGFRGEWIHIFLWIINLNFKFKIDIVCYSCIEFFYLYVLCL